MKYVFITGGVASSLGKGVTAAALGCLLKARGYRVSMQKLNLYYNAEPAFLSPLEHGEAFITEDGHAVDLDLGNYERLVDETLPGECCCTTGKIHRRLLERELRGDFHGMTIQAIPHVANEIKSHIEGVAERSRRADQHCGYRRHRGGYGGGGLSGGHPADAAGTERSV